MELAKEVFFFQSIRLISLNKAMRRKRRGVDMVKLVTLVAKAVQIVNL